MSTLTNGVNATTCMDAWRSIVVNAANVQDAVLLQRGSERVQAEVIGG